MHHLAGMLAAAVIASVNGLAAAPASGQAIAFEVGAEEEGDIEPWGGGRRVTRVDLNSMIHLLDLDESQTSAATELFETYSAALRDASAKFNEWNQAWTKLNPNWWSDSDKEKEHQEKQKLYNEHLEKLRTKLLEDVQLLLREEQQANWERVERRMRRRETIAAASIGAASGARADLIAITEQVFAPDDVPSDVEPVLEQYELESDRAMKALQEWHEEWRTRWEERESEASELSQEEQMQLGLKFMREAREKSLELRDVNVRYLARIGAMLPEMQRDKMEDRFYRTAFGYAWMMGAARGNQVNAERAFAGAEKAGLTEEQRAQLAEIKKQYHRESRERAKKDAEAIMEQEEEFAKREITSLIDMMGAFDYMAIQKMTAERQRFEESVIERVRSLLTPEQIEKAGPPLQQETMPDLEFEE